MLIKSYLEAMVKHIKYTTDESGDIIARIPNHQWYYSFGTSHEDARDNLLDTIESIVLAKIADRDPSIIEEMKSYSISRNTLEYA
jgi:hypothetical protein